MPPLLIQDGYSLHDRVPATPNLNDEVDYVYRLAHFRDRTAYQGTMLAPDERQKVGAGIICRHLVSMKYGGRPVTLTEESAEHLIPHVFAWVIDRVLGYQAPSESPDATNLADEGADAGNSPRA
jgi:hypothetical protein